MSLAVRLSVQQWQMAHERERVAAYRFARTSQMWKARRLAMFSTESPATGGTSNGASIVQRRPAFAVTRRH